MDENNIAESELTGEEEAFDIGWDDDDTGYHEPEEETEPETEAENAGEEAPAGDGEDQPAADGEQKPEETGKAQEEGQQEESFELKYMGDTLKVGREEMIALAQKGKDYDRIRQERDSQNTELEKLRADQGKFHDYEGFLEKLATSVGMDIPTMMESTLAKLLVAEEARKGNSITEDFALQRIRFDREKAAFEQQKTGTAQKKEPEAEAKAEEEPKAKDTAEDAAAKARINDEVNAFLKRYPGIDPKTIAPEVLQAWRSGTPLLYAYLEHENKTLRAEHEAMEQNTKNSQRSTGSAKSAGAAQARDPVFAGWDD